jgi:sirohydrochlorin cobaltochelatase
MLVLVAHGSRDPDWRASVESIIESLERELGSGRVRLAYMDLSPPTLMDVVSGAAAAGETEFRILPLFLAPQGHVERDVKPLTQEVQAAWPDLDVELLPALGQLPEYQEALGRIAIRTAGTRCP